MLGQPKEPPRDSAFAAATLQAWYHVTLRPIRAGHRRVSTAILLPSHARDELAKASSLVLTARRLLSGGALVDLSALEQRVRDLCQAVQQMPIEDARDLEQDLQGLIRRLDQLAGDLRDRLQHLSRLPAGDE